MIHATTQIRAAQIFPVTLVFLFDFASGVSLFASLLLEGLERSLNMGAVTQSEKIHSVCVSRRNIASCGTRTI